MTPSGRIQSQQALRLLTQRQWAGSAHRQLSLSHRLPTELRPRSRSPSVAARTFSTSTLHCQDAKSQQPQPQPQLHSQSTEHLPPPGIAPKPTRSWSYRGRRFIFALIFLGLGTSAGSAARLLLAPPTPPEPGSEEDIYTTELLHERAEKLPIVQELSEDPAWQSWPAYNTLSAEHKAQHITAGAVSGSRGVGGYQRVFYNASTGELASVIFFGPATTGWPGVVHGGLLATILDESCGRAAFKQWGGRSGLTAKLNLQYVSPTLSNGFYLIRAKPRSDDELPESERGKRHYKSFVDAQIEDARTGKVTVVAEALFVGGAGRNGNKGVASSLANADANAQF